VWLALASGNGLLMARLRAATAGLPIPDLEPLRSPGWLYALLEAYGEHGRRAYLSFTVFDMVYPLAAYAFFAVAIAALTTALSTRASASLLALPIVGLVLELAEQTGFLLILVAFPRRLHAVAWLTSVLTALKLAVLAAMAFAVAALCGWRAWRALRGPGDG
jgi:hypothetical protein